MLNIKFNEVGDLYNIINVISFELFPQTISKHLGEYPIEVMLLSENLNVSTAVTPVYVALGYLGITIYFLYYSSVFFLVTLMLKGDMRKVIIVLFSTLSMFMIFFNVIIMPIFIFSILVSFFMSLSVTRNLRC